MQAHGCAASSGFEVILHKASRTPWVLCASRNFTSEGWISNMASIGRYCGDFLSGSTARIYVAHRRSVLVTARNAN
jgi:hypothetical protein